MVQSLTSQTFYHFDNEEKYFPLLSRGNVTSLIFRHWLSKEASLCECAVLLLLAALDPVNVSSSGFVFCPPIRVLVNPLQFRRALGSQKEISCFSSVSNNSIYIFKVSHFNANMQMTNIWEKPWWITSQSVQADGNVLVLVCAVCSVIYRSFTKYFSHFRRRSRGLPLCPRGSRA